jgi:cell wall-associated NlpC family hydrolase
MKLVGTKYGSWDGALPLSRGEPMWRENAPAPPLEEVRAVSCAGLVNLILRSNGIPLPYTDDSIGGTWAYGIYYKKVAKPFALLPIYPVGTLIGRYYKNYEDQGHVAILLADRKILQSCPNEGCTDTVLIDDMHSVYEYDYMVYPEDWSNI